MRKILVLTLCFLIILSSCIVMKKSDINPFVEKESISTKIPFITYYNNKEKNEVIGKLSYWDIKDKNISFTDNVVYTTAIKPNSIINPIMWDGNKKIVLFHNSYPGKDYIENSKVIKEYTQDTVYGRDIEAKRNQDKIDKKKNKDYTLFLRNKNGTLEKTATFLFNTKDENNKNILIGETDIPSYIDYNNTTGEITFIFKYFFQTHSSIFIAKCNVENVEKVNWQEILLSKEIHSGGGLTPYPSNSALIGAKYYIQSSLSFAEVNLETNQSKILEDLNKTCRGVVKESNFIPDYPKEILPIGIFDDVLILKVPISANSGMEYLICAFKNNIFLGAIHLKGDDSWNIIDQNKKIITKIKVKDKDLYKEFNSDLLYFPFYGV